MNEPRARSIQPSVYDLGLHKPAHLSIHPYQGNNCNYCLWCNYIMIKDCVFAFLDVRCIFPFLFEQNPFSSYDFKSDLAENRHGWHSIKLAIFITSCICSQCDTVGTAIFVYWQTCKIEHLQSICFMTGTWEITKPSLAGK